MNLFDITRAIENPLGSKPRAANDSEISAYMQWKRERLGLADMGETRMHFHESRNGRRYERGHCIGATFGKQPERGTWETGAYSIVMPGHNAHRARVTMETLDDAGEVVASSTMPVEPKKGGAIWTREAVREAAGPIAKPAKGKAAPKCAEIASQSGAGEAIAPCVAHGGGEAVEVLCEAPSAPHRFQHTTPEETAAMLYAKHGVDVAPIAEPAPEAPDPIAELAARIEALEARLAALSAESVSSANNAKNSGDEYLATPTVAKRTPTHERAVRRAWAMRAQRNKLLTAYNRSGDDRRALRKERDDWQGEAQRLQTRLTGTQELLDTMHENYRALARTLDETEESLRDAMAKRRRSTMLARDLGKRLNAEYSFADKRSAANRERMDELRTERDFERARADTLHAQLARIASETADYRERARPGVSRLLAGGSAVALRAVA